jgi:hypothetical protein
MSPFVDSTSVECLFSTPPPTTHVIITEEKMKRSIMVVTGTSGSLLRAKVRNANSAIRIVTSAFTRALNASSDACDPYG